MAKVLNTSAIGCAEERGASFANDAPPLSAHPMALTVQDLQTLYYERSKAL